MGNEYDVTKKIVAYHNERPFYLERCNGYTCDWETFKKLFQDEIRCPFDDICSLEEDLPKEVTDVPVNESTTNMPDYDYNDRKEDVYVDKDDEDDSEDDDSDESDNDDSDGDDNDEEEDNESNDDDEDDSDDGD